MSALHIASRDIVDDGIAPHMMHGILPVDRPPAAPDDHREFGFVIEFTGDLGIEQDGRTWTNDTIGELREHDRCGWRRAAAGRVEAARRYLLHMCVVVLADAENIAPWPRDWGEQFDRRQTQRMIDVAQ